MAYLYLRALAVITILVCRITSASHITTTPGFDLSNYPWIAPGPNDARGPCPGMNTLANHGILPRNGSNITVDMALQAALDGFNIHPSILVTPAKLSMLVSQETDNFDLADLRVHENIEHDASLSRNDIYFGDNYSFNETLFSTLVNVSDPSSLAYNATDAGKAMKTRLEQSMATNPELINTSKEYVIRSREASLYLAVMGNATTGVAKKDFVNVFFREERLPIEEGWVRSDITITSTLLDATGDIVKAAAEWPGPNSDCSTLVIAPDGTNQSLANAP